LTLPIDPGASEEDSEFFSRSTDKSGRPGPNCLIVKDEQRKARQQQQYHPKE
jgi:hypothetical protein